MDREAKARGKLLPHGEKVDISTWSLQSVEGLKQEIERVAYAAANEALTLAISYEAFAWFPHEWDFGDQPSDGINGPLPDDPMTIHINLPLGEHDGEGPTWSVSLRTMVREAIDGSMSPADGKIATEHVKGMAAIRDGLRGLAQAIDDALTTPERA